MESIITPAIDHLTTTREASVMPGPLRIFACLPATDLGVRNLEHLRELSAFTLSWFAPAETTRRRRESVPLSVNGEKRYKKEPYRVPPHSGGGRAINCNC